MTMSLRNSRTAQGRSYGPVQNTATFVVFSLLVILGSCALVQLPVAQGAKFVLTDTQPVCFVEEITENTQMIKGEYICGSEKSGVPVVMKIRHQDGKFEKDITMMPGRHTFSFDIEGQRTTGQIDICLTAGSQGWLASASDPVNIEFVIDQDDERQSQVTPNEMYLTQRKKYENKELFTFTDHGGQLKEILTSPQYLRGLEGKLDEVEELVDRLSEDMNYLQGRMNRMRVTSETTFDRVWMCSAVLVVVIAAVTWMQFSSLKAMLRRKKMV